ncbi:hypothetical protein AVEN_74430-1 [Araneus ventricosus]|uniref:Uncharacterized protein n=1 Tax=Araneus ventricosus TaxID=182803 RepID=A0A4Y2UPY1_ARAVE|nr:hypothetical protein AVEN_74430-1 [Araneus ventricosus]
MNTWPLDQCSLVSWPRSPDLTLLDFFSHIGHPQGNLVSSIAVTTQMDLLVARLHAVCTSGAWTSAMLQHVFTIMRVKFRCLDINGEYLNIRLNCRKYKCLNKGFS